MACSVRVSTTCYSDRPVDSSVVALILVSALLHAGWNTLVKLKGDPLIMLASIAATATLWTLPTLAVVPFPAAEVWPYLLLSMILHTLYNLLLFAGYKHGDLGQVYPIARGVAPLLVAGVAPFVAAETVTAFTLSGVLLIAAGVMSLAFSGARPLGENPRPVLYALGAALFIASYTTMDGLGARVAASPHSYIAWLFILDGIPISVIAVWLRGREVLDWVRRNWARGTAGGAMSVVGYWLVVWALSIGALAPVAALREVGVIIAAVLASVVLKERFGPRRIAAAVLVAAGAILLRWS